jgi:hypothetical protein
VAYTDVDQVIQATRVAGDIVGRIDVALLQQAVTRMTQLTTDGTDPLKERLVIHTVFQGDVPKAWRVIVLRLLDLAGQLAAPSDANINTQTVAAWGHIVNARRLVS